MVEILMMLALSYYNPPVTADGTIQPCIWPKCEKVELVQIQPCIWPKCGKVELAQFQPCIWPKCAKETGTAL